LCYTGRRWRVLRAVISNLESLSEMLRTIRMQWAILHLLALNIARAWRWRLLRFRLLTYGVYEAHPWYGRQAAAHRWWQVNPRVAWLLFRHATAYGRWLVEMGAAMQAGQPGWWEQQAGPAGYERLRAWMDAENGPPLADSEETAGRQAE